MVSKLFSMEYLTIQEMTVFTMTNMEHMAKMELMKILILHIEKFMNGMKMEKYMDGGILTTCQHVTKIAINLEI